MRFIPILLTVSLISCEALRGPVGPAGPAGPQGEQGKSGVVNTTVKRGVLYSSEKVSGKEFWDIHFLLTDDFYVSLSDTLLINCYVRYDADYMWNTPTWYHTKSYVRIFDDDKTDAGYEYIITAIVP